MDFEFWLDAWQDGRRGWHKGEPNDNLVTHAAELFPARGRVLVPLCGATHDLAWLADQGFSAIGVELSPVAVEELVARDGLTASAARGPFACWTGHEGRITVLEGDAFALTPEHTGPIDAIWDRAALVALRADQRVDFVALEQRLLGDGVLLLDTLSYDQSLRDGPPWSVDREIVESLWPGIEVLHEKAAPIPEHWADHGIDTVTDWLFVRRGE